MQGSSLQHEKIAVVGAGVGGLATAARLASRGFAVDVFEKLPRCGGRANVIVEQGFTIDTGPSFILMPDFFEEVFRDCGADIKDYLTLQPLETSYRIIYGDDADLVMYSDPQRKKEALARLEPGADQAYARYLQELAGMYGQVRPLLYQCFTLKDAFNPKYWSLLFRLKAFQTYWQIAAKYFQSDKIRYALTFQAMFIGVSPFSAPAFYSIITYAEHAQKVFHPMGGMYQVPKALEKLGARLNVNYHYNTEVTKVEDRGAQVRLIAGGREYVYDRVVINADYPYAKETLLGQAPATYNYSCSVYLMYLALNTKVKGLEHHCLFLSPDVRANLDDIFRGHRVPDEPSFYTYVPTVTDPSLAPAGKDIVYILVPVPNFTRGAYAIKEQEEKIREYVFARIKKQTGEDLRRLVLFERKFLPEDLGRYNLKFASAFGLAHSLFQSAFFRPPNFDGRSKNIYYVGASTQPGGGLPPVLAGSKIVADQISRKAT
ncbi:MAG TPA: phytoene desaturase family protein [Candidatus Omnitrophota bacterium]|nr:phytoene desaturase family protein [Candidatus Omnitrophota bacterium]